MGRVEVPWLALALATLLGVAWLVPNHYLPWPGFYSEVPAFLAGTLIVGSALLVNRPSRIPMIAALMIAAAIIPWLQWISGQLDYSGDAVLTSVYLVGAGLCLWAGHATAATQGDRLLSALAWAVLAGSIASTGIALYQWFGLEGLEIWAVQGVAGARAVGNVAQPNHLATLLLWGLAAVVMLRANGVLGSRTAAATAVFLVLGLALTQSRTPWLAFGVLTCWMLGRRSSLLTPLRLRPLAVAGLLAWYVIAFWAVLVLPTDLRLEGDPGSARMAAGTRPLLWSQMWEALVQSPWAGFGWQQGLTAQATAALLPLPSAEYSNYAHNLLLDLLVWNGLPIGLLLAAAFAWWYFSLGTSAAGPAQWFRLAVVSCFGAHAMVEYPHAYAYFLVPVALVAGQLDAQRRQAPLWDAPRVLLASLAAIVLVGGAAVMRDYVLIEHDRRELQYWFARIGGAREMAPLPPIWVLDQMAAASKVARSDVTQGMTEAEVAEVGRIARRFPGVFFLRRYIIALALNGRQSEASVELQRLRGLHGEDQYLRALAAMRELADTRHPQLRSFIDQATRR